jgi:hypothetical protein
LIHKQATENAASGPLIDYFSKDADSIILDAIKMTINNSDYKSADLFGLKDLDASNNQD